MLNRLFHLTELNTTVRTEVIAGITTFLTMAYIIFVQPAVLSGSLFGFSTGVDAGSVITATCISSAVACLLMGVLANYPIGLAPGMGQNFFFTLNVLPAVAAVIAANGWQHTTPWQIAFGVIFIAGLIFILISIFGIREALMNAISPSMKNAIAVGIGLFIAFVGLHNAGLIIASPGTLVKLNTALYSPDLIVFFFGLILIAVLHTRRVRGSILWGIAATTVFALVFRPILTHFLPGSAIVESSDLVARFQIAHAIVDMPPSMSPTFFQMDLIHACALPMIPYIIVFLFMDVFDTIGTLIGVSEQAGLMKDNKLPRAGKAMMADAIGTVVGAAAGTSTVTSFIESAAGVEQGGRSGLVAVVVAIGFILALFFAPVIAMVGSYPAITAPALVIVGAMMIRNVRYIDFDDYSEAIPAFLTMISVPLCYNIGDGLAIGFITYPLVKLLSGRRKDVSWMMYALAAILLAYFIFVRSRM